MARSMIGCKVKLGFEEPSISSLYRIISTEEHGGRDHRNQIWMNVNVKVNHYNSGGPLKLNSNDCFL